MFLALSRRQTWTLERLLFTGHQRSVLRRMFGLQVLAQVARAVAIFRSLAASCKR